MQTSSQQTSAGRSMEGAVSSPLNLPLMDNNISREDLNEVIRFLQTDSILTQSKNVLAFEKAWSDWLGVQYSVFINSGSAANLMSIAAVKHLYGDGEIILPPLTWVSDVAAVLQNGMKPVFVDINPNTLAMNDEKILAAITDRTKAVFLTHILGLNGLTERLLSELERRKIMLIEDVCESHGATFKGRKVGSFGQISNFSFYYAHHMSTIEGGMVCTNDERLYQTFRMLRAHGMVREANSESFRSGYHAENPDLNPDFIFAYPAYNFRSTEINAVMGLNQLKRLDANNEKRRANFRLFLKNLDSKKYRTELVEEGSCNYAFIVILRNPDARMRDELEATLRREKVEFRRGTSGGGNQLRQPYLKKALGAMDYTKFPEVEHVHFYGYYIGNFPDLESRKILRLCEILNSVPSGK